MANYDKINAWTATDLANLIDEKWSPDIYKDAMRRGFFHSKGLVGQKGLYSPVVRKTDLTKGSGDTIHMQVMSQLKGAGTVRSTDGNLVGREEKPTVGQFDVTVAKLSHAVGITDEASQEVIVDAILMAGNMLGPWLATKWSDEIFKAMLITALAKMNVSYADSVASTRSVLGTACELVTASSGFSVHSLDMDDCMKAKLSLVTRGALPISVTRDNGQKTEWHAGVVDAIDGYRLKISDKWAQAQRDANIQGEHNPIFTGAIGAVGGLLLFEYAGIAGEKGTPMRPEATLTSTYTAGGGGTIMVGTDTKTDYTRNFPDPAVTGETETLWLGNPVDGTDANILKVAVQYTGKTNNTFTGVTEGALDPNPATVGTVVTLENTSRNLFFGAEMCAFAEALPPTKITNSESYGEDIGVGIKTIFGVKAIENSAGNIPNAIILKTYAHSPL